VLQNKLVLSQLLEGGGQEAKAAVLGAETAVAGRLWGLGAGGPQVWARMGAAKLGTSQAGSYMTDAAIDERIAAAMPREKLRSWPESDRIPDELVKAGVVLEDKPRRSDELAPSLNGEACRPYCGGSRPGTYYRPRSRPLAFRGSRSDPLESWRRRMKSVNDPPAARN